jgi:hypothetical protein
MNNDAGTLQGDRFFHPEEEKTVEDYVNGVGDTATPEQVAIQNRSTNVQKQLDTQQRTDDLRSNNSGMNDSTANRSGDDNDKGPRVSRAVTGRRRLMAGVILCASIPVLDFDAMQ